MDELFLNQDAFEKIFINHLKIETYSKSIDSLFSLRLLNKIDYKPYYQRNYVWDKDKATYFIESILLGTEIPPLIFFNNGKKIEVIDGRQRFETIKKFKENDLVLTSKGLSVLKQLAKQDYNSLSKGFNQIIDIFLDAKIRIVEFEIVNEPPLDSDLEDKVKKEIFSRYNSGITPLKKAEIDNAVYDKDILSGHFRSKLKEDKELLNTIYSIFFKEKQDTVEPPIEEIMSFIRRQLVIISFPIRYYARGTSRTDIVTRLYQYLADKDEEPTTIFKEFIRKVKLIKTIKDAIDKTDVNANRLFYECLLWGILALEKENIDIKKVLEKESIVIADLIEFLKEKNELFIEVGSHYYNEIINRYSSIADLFEKIFNVSLQVYLDTNQDFKSKILSNKIDASETVTKLGELESLRVTKPDPSRNSIDDILKAMNRRRFLLRPSYQRSEVIDLVKASAIIESILLGINLPPIFIFKRLDGVSEVIDGQQRLLTIIGYIGEGYVDENNDTKSTKNHEFQLKRLRILKDLKGKSFKNLDEKLQNKIFDFELFVVEIEERLNPEFNPVDLFIRLNDKPYPIREHSFEMWNSWANRDIMKIIKENAIKKRDWFYLKKIKNPNDRDRMENEELYTSLAYLDFKHRKVINDNDTKFLAIYQKIDRINARVTAKKDISNILEKISQSKEQMEDFLVSIKNTERFISKVRLILIDRDIEKIELTNYLDAELDNILKIKNKRYFKRTMQDFYILWYLLIRINYEMVKYHRLNMKDDIKSIFYYMKNIPTDDLKDNLGYQRFIDKINDFWNKYKQDDRKLRLSNNEKANLIKDQGNRCNLSDAPVFISDDIEVDHIEPLAIGGSDTLDNLQIVHKDSNRKKGSKIR